MSLDSDLSLGDFARSLGALQPDSDAEIAAIADLLGFSWGGTLDRNVGQPDAEQLARKEIDPSRDKLQVRQRMRRERSPAARDENADPAKRIDPDSIPILEPISDASRVFVERDEIIVHVRLESGELTSTISAPSGIDTAQKSWSPLGSEAIDQLTRGSGFRGQQTPGLSDSDSRGRQLASLLFGETSEPFFKQWRHSRIVFIIHDAESSKLPFEMLSVKPEGEEDEVIRPAVGAGISRRLLVGNSTDQPPVSKPPSMGKIRILLVINPTSDLPGAEAEGKDIAAILQKTDRLDVIQLIAGQATKSAVGRELTAADVFHFAGHAYSEGPGGPHETGLVLADGHLTLSDIARSGLGMRMAFINDRSGAFAEFFLQAGIEAFLGPYWEVGDAAAAQFAAGVYTLLAEGERLDDAVSRSRAELLQAGERDWANYQLYGDGRFRLVREPVRGGSEIAAHAVASDSPAEVERSRRYLPLFTPNWQNQIIVETLSSTIPAGGIDFDRVIEQVAVQRPVERLPLLPWRTLLSGVEFLIDIGDQMEPYMNDARQLRLSVEEILRSGVEVRKFRDCPLPGCGAGPVPAWQPFTPPASGTPIIVVGHFSASVAAGRIGGQRSVIDQWLELIQILDRSACPLIGISPLPASRLPRRLQGRIKIVHWDRTTTIGAVRDALKN